jgi:hypothetical protein
VSIAKAYEVRSYGGNPNFEATYTSASNGAVPDIGKSKTKNRQLKADYDANVNGVKDKLAEIGEYTNIISNESNIFDKHSVAHTLTSREQPIIPGTDRKVNYDYRERGQGKIAMLYTLQATGDSTTSASASLLSKIKQEHIDLNKPIKYGTRLPMSPSEFARDTIHEFKDGQKLDNILNDTQKEDIMREQGV